MIPEGELLRSRVVGDLGPPLEDALDRRLDGYAVLQPRDSLLGPADDRGVLTFQGGVPALAYHVGADRGGPRALAAIGAGPHRLELYALAAADLDVAHAADQLRVPPGMPAERLAGAADLAVRTRRIAGADREPDTDESAIEAFLDDEEAIAELRADARREARARAAEWRFTEALAETDALADVDAHADTGVPEE